MLICVLLIGETIWTTGRLEPRPPEATGALSVGVIPEGVGVGGGTVGNDSKTGVLAGVASKRVDVAVGLARGVGDGADEHAGAIASTRNESQMAKRV